MTRIPFSLTLVLSLTLAVNSTRAEVNWFDFKADYIAGSKDPNGQMRRGTEVMRLMAHDGKLYAALGIFMQNYSDGPLTGAQILRKDKADGPWFVEKTFGPDYLRVDNFCEATFTQDKDGKKLSSPVTLFVAGLYAVYKRNTGQPSHAAVAVYNNKPGDWTTVKIAAPPMGPSNPMFASAAYMRVYEDTVTYDWGKVADPHHLKDGVELHGIRTVAFSPWQQGVYYFGGYAAQDKNKSDTAWIYEARVKPGLVAKTTGTKPEPARPVAKAQPPRSAPAARGSGNIETTFRQLDHNGDGKLDASEAGERPFFKPADKNGDGVLTLDEVKAYFGSRPLGKSPAASKLQPTEKP